MEFYINTGELLGALDMLHNISQAKNVRPILANTLIDGTGDRLKITTTDLEIGMTISKTARITEPGRITLPTQELYKLAGKLGASNDMHFKEESNFWMTILSGKSRFRLAGLDPEEYPEVMEVGKGAKFSIPNSLMSRLVDYTIFSVSTDINKKVLNGIFVESSGPGKVRMVATDGHRLGKVEALVAEGVEDKFGGVVLPSKGLKELRRILSGREGVSEWTLGESAARIREGEFEMTLRYIEGAFPGYQRVIPESSRIQVAFDRKELQEALGRVSVFASDKYIGVHCEIQSGSAKIAFNNPGIGEASEEISTDYSQETFQISFNARYLNDLLTNLTEKRVTLEVNEAQSPCMVREMEGEISKVYIVMPMML